MRTYLCIILCLLLLPQVFALTAAPAKHEVTEQGRQEFVFTLRNEVPIDVSVNFEGKLAPYATGPESVQIDGEERVRIIVTPPKLDEGSHELHVIFRTEARGGQVGAVAEIAPLIRYNIPYSTAYINYTLGVQDGKDPLVVTLMLRNIGSRQTTVQPSFELEGLEDPILTEPIALGPGAITRTTTTLPQEIQATGEYVLKLQLDSEAPGEKQSSRTVLLGRPIVHVQNVQAEGRPGTIVPITLTTTTVWNKEVQGRVAATVSGTNREWLLQPQEIAFAGTQDITLYWENAEYGTYDVNLEIALPGGVQEFTQELQFAPSPKKGFPLWILLILFLLLIGATYLLLFKNK